MSKADDMLMEHFDLKQEEYYKNELSHIEYKTNYQYVKNNKVKFRLKSKTLEIEGEINTECLQAINEKVKELGWE